VYSFGEAPDHAFDWKSPLPPGSKFTFPFITVPDQLEEAHKEKKVDHARIYRQF